MPRLRSVKNLVRDIRGDDAQEVGPDLNADADAGVRIQHDRVSWTSSRAPLDMRIVRVHDHLGASKIRQGGRDRRLCKPGRTRDLRSTETSVFAQRPDDATGRIATMFLPQQLI